MPSERKTISPKSGSCMARGPNLSALRTPSQSLTGWGGFQRRSPTGGWANGTPLNARTPFSSVTPSMTPLAVRTRSSAEP